MALAKEYIKNQNKDCTPYTDEQIDYLVEVKNKMAWPWVCFKDGDVEVMSTQGCFDDVFVLKIKGICTMTTHAYNLIEHRSIYEQASGDVLLTGLGLGLCVLLCDINEKINSVTVIENNTTIIKNIMPLILKSCNRVVPIVIEHDANTWTPSKIFDFAFIDHSCQRAEDERYIPYCKKIINWHDTMMENYLSWR